MGGRQQVRVAVATRPYPGFEVSGDAPFVDEGDTLLRLALIDGAGHGPAAFAAASAAAGHLGTVGHLGVERALRSCHQALAGTRGAAVTLVHIDLENGELEFVGAGNVDLRILRGAEETHHVTQRGVLGYTLPTPRPQRLSLGDSWLLALSSDGIRSRFRFSDPGLPQASPETLPDLAESIIARFARADDDASVLVAMGWREDGP